MMDQVFSPRVRSWIYGVSVALIALLVALGVIADGLDTQILNLVAAVLGLNASALASVYRPTRVPEDAPDVYAE
ncbi:phage holin [Trueperella bialowiezensis]|uniref:Holin n=1 Tax=Trueperella bialowiezensis TaxID=312285 RepID=A0A448PE89_9ACTO|nr:hypothetical protein [Trueperella bialowiezensis]VEI13204.1 Uncharacterised protein [Trueperella bialowiezensis]